VTHFYVLFKSPRLWKVKRIFKDLELEDLVITAAFSFGYVSHMHSLKLPSLVLVEIRKVQEKHTGLTHISMFSCFQNTMEARKPIICHLSTTELKSGVRHHIFPPSPSTNSIASTARKQHSIKSSLKDSFKQVDTASASKNRRKQPYLSQRSDKGSKVQYGPSDSHVIDVRDPDTHVIEIPDEYPLGEIKKYKIYLAQPAMPFCYTCSQILHAIISILKVVVPATFFCSFAFHVAQLDPLLPFIVCIPGAIMYYTVLFVYNSFTPSRGHPTTLGHSLVYTGFTPSPHDDAGYDTTVAAPAYTGSLYYRDVLLHSGLVDYMRKQPYSSQHTDSLPDAVRSHMLKTPFDNLLTHWKTLSEDQELDYVQVCYQFAVERKARFEKLPRIAARSIGPV
jgi:hypothetical protein